MKGILGRKVGMTQLYSEHGRLIPITVIEVKSNVITSVLSKHKNGYEAIQLGIEDKKTSKRNKPETGHAKRANTTPKLFTKEIRGMTGFKLGSTIDASIFTAGEFVDIQGISKGHGFSGTIKKHNQSIGPKSHGGGGGSKPQRQTGSLGDISGNKVIKGMTMPGQYGNIKTTIQNLEVISIDTNNNVILIKGSIPGPKKSFVIIKEATKDLKSKKTIKLVDVHENIKKNDLLEKAKTIGANFNSKMSINELEKSIKAKKTFETETKDTTNVLNSKKIKEMHNGKKKN